MHDGLSWEALEHHHEEKNADWFWSLGIITVSVAILCIILGNLLLAIFILIAAFTSAAHARRLPKLQYYELNFKGIIINNNLYRYSTLDSFWIEEEHHEPHIILKSKKLFVPFIIVPIQEYHHDDIRDFLLMHLKEVEHHESLWHRVLEYFGF